ncbi:uncharacterized protein LOC111884432 [Lactuca sativa]|uniref:uncharacterized protein LOC111884432 n=1 Tax=Lactuca sativa TaxID=4236 RepID=UPI000CD8F308|nr:uncharacterized protein LOC111884432 [Lactuca sativa]
MATTLKPTVRAAKNVEIQLREKGLERAEVGEKRKFVGFEKRNRSPRYDPNNKRYEDSNEEMFCDKCRRKHVGRCSKEVTCFKYGKTGHYADECTTKKEVCFKCGEEGHHKHDCPNKERATKPNVSPKPKTRAFQMILNEATDNARNQERGLISEDQVMKLPCG